MNTFIIKHTKVLFYTWFAIIMILSLIPSPSAPALEKKIEFRLDYLEHFLVFVPLGFLWAARKKPLRITIIVLLIVSAIPEIIQIAVPYRRFNPYDLLINIMGTAAGYLLAFINPFKKLIKQ